MVIIIKNLIYGSSCGIDVTTWAWMGQRLVISCAVWCAELMYTARKIRVSSRRSGRRWN